MTTEPPPVTERLTIALVPAAAGAIRAVQGRSGWKKVDVVNRAAVVYEFIDAAIRDGKAVILRDQDGKEETIRIL